jgi:hypothetical protein
MHNAPIQHGSGIEHLDSKRVSRDHRDTAGRALSECQSGLYGGDAPADHYGVLPTTQTVHVEGATENMIYGRSDGPQLARPFRPMRLIARADSQHYPFGGNATLIRIYRSVSIIKTESLGAPGHRSSVNRNLSITSSV